MSPHKLSLGPRINSGLMVLTFTLCFLSMALPQRSFGQGLPVRQADFIPQEILDIDMGISSGWLLERIKNSGTHATVPLARPNRIKIIWVLNNNPYYEQLEFFFTEKDRLYLVRFSLNEESRWNVNALKKQFFDKFHISTERPNRLRLGKNDAIVYSPADGGKSHFFEVTEIGSGKKFLELFETKIDRQDRPPAKPANQGETKQQDKAVGEPAK